MYIHADPAICECVWLMIVVGCVCRLVRSMCVGVGVVGEEYVCGCGCVRSW